MKNFLISIVLASLFFGCNTEPKKKSEVNQKTNEFAIIIHGGAGTILKKNMTPEKEKAYQEKLAEAIKVGHLSLIHI